MRDDALYARHGIGLPLVLSDEPDELGCVLDARGHEVFTVNTLGTWPDATALIVAARLCRDVNRAHPRPISDPATALESTAAILRPIAEADEAAMAAFQVAEDALAEIRQAGA